MVGTTVTVGYGLATGFERSADQADLPDIIARFSDESRRRVDERVRALPNLAARSYRYEVTGVPLQAGTQSLENGGVHVVLGGARRGYAITEGRDLSPASGEVVIERGLARDWDLAPGDELLVGSMGTLRVAGVAVSPDNVAYPLSKVARVYVGRQEVAERLGFSDLEANLALLWLNDPSKSAVTLTQARAVTFGIGDLSFVTRAGVKILLDQAAGIVISLLVAFSLVALVAAGTMLTAGAHADVQRRLQAFGIQRALGYGPGRIAAVQAAEAALVALPAAVLGLAVGAFAVSGAAAGLLAALNEQPPGAALLGPLALCLLGIVALVSASATWPAWRAARRSPASILRGGDLARRRPGPGSGATRRGGLLGLGARFAVAARARWAAAVATIGVCAGIVLLMLALASLLERLREDPGTVGKRYQLSVRFDPERLDEIRAVPGIAAAGERYSTSVSDAYRLGEPLRIVAFPGDHTRFEAPPLDRGRRVRAASEAEVGVGLADALGLRPGSPFAVQTESGAEVRFRVVGVVRALENDGRIAFVQPGRLLAAEPGLDPGIAVRVDPGADRAQVAARLAALGARPAAVGGAAPRNGAFLGVLAAVLRGVGLAVGLVCLYALVQALTMTARERRGAVALLRSLGGDARDVGLLLGGAALAVALPAAVLGLVLERLLFGPLVARLAAGFADLPLAPSAGQALLVVAGLAALAAAATALVARKTLREPIVRGLREE